MSQNGQIHFKIFAANGTLCIKGLRSPILSDIFHGDIKNWKTLQQKLFILFSLETDRLLFGYFLITITNVCHLRFDLGTATAATELFIPSVPLVTRQPYQTQNPGYHFKMRSFKCIQCTA